MSKKIKILEIHIKSLKVFFQQLLWNITENTFRQCSKRPTVRVIGKNPTRAVFFFQENMEKLMTGTYLFINPRKNRIPIKKKAVLKDSAILNEIDPVLYYGWHHNSAMWEFFPRHLTKKEFLNPYLAIEKFFKAKDLKRWLKDFKELISYSLSPYGNETGVEFDYLRIHKHLQKLVEAAHLIEARVIRSNRDVGKK